jgi:hypothetical protein
MSFLINSPGGLAAMICLPLFERLLSPCSLSMSFMGDIVILPRNTVVYFINKADRGINDNIVLFEIIDKRDGFSRKIKKLKLNIPFENMSYCL